jgi:hypothetical protein
VVPAEGTIELRLQKKSLLKKYFYKNQQRRRNESSIEDAELTAEDVDDLGDFAADIAEQPLGTSKHSKAKSLIEVRPKKYRKNFIVTQLGKRTKKHMKKSLLRKTQLI